MYISELDPDNRRVSWKLDFLDGSKVISRLQVASIIKIAESYVLFCHAQQHSQRYTHRVLQTIQMKIILLCVWAEWAVLGSAKTTLKFKYEI